MSVQQPTFTCGGTGMHCKLCQKPVQGLRNMHSGCYMQLRTDMQPELA
jgi:hypothetical protein